jgi:hypothetical protein
MAAEAEGRTMAEDRIAVLEERLAAVERAVAELRAKNRMSNGKPFVSTNPNDPLDGHPLISKKLPPIEAAAHKARVEKSLGIEGIEPTDPAQLRQMMIEEDGLDPNGTEFSRGIIEMREE